MLLAALISATGFTHWAVVEKARACLRGDEVVVIPGSIDLGTCRAGAALEPRVQIVNLTSSPVTVTGISTPCSCVLAGALPVTIRPYATHNLGLTIHTPEKAGGFERRAAIYTSSRVSPQFEIAITGETKADGDGVAETAASNGTDRRAEQVSEGNISLPEHEPELAVLPSRAARRPSPGE